jgi:hypothetical protein
MKKRNYSTVEELLLADGFLNWYYLKGEKEIHEWNEWIAISPEHKHLADQAVEMILLIWSAKENKITEQEIRAETNRLTRTIRNMKAGIINMNGEW